MSERKRRNDSFKPNKKCTYYNGSGCKHGDNCTFLHEISKKSRLTTSEIHRASDGRGRREDAERNSVEEENVMEVLEVPVDQVKLIIGRGGSTVNRLSSEFGDAHIHIPDQDKQDSTKTTTSITITAKWRTVRKIIQNIAEILRNTNRDSSFLNKKMIEYKIISDTSVVQTERDTQESAASEAEPVADKSKEKVGDKSRRTLLTAPAISSLMSVGTSYNMLPVPVPPPPEWNQRTAEDLPQMGSGWGPLVDHQLGGDEIPFLENRVPEDYFNYPVAINQPEVTHPVTVPKEDKILPDKRGFIPLSQHVVISSNYPSRDHKSGLVVQAQEIVTFTKFCECSKNCAYGCFRNAVDMIGYIPMELVSEDILKFECPYCDEINEFYQERGYLEHMCTVHFWRRISSFLRHSEPYQCPLSHCKFVGKDFSELVFHYGTIPHRKVGALILDSVGERVKNMKMDSLRSNGPDALIHELDNSKRVIGDLQDTINVMNSRPQKSSEAEEAESEELQRLKSELRLLDSLKERLHQLEGDLNQASTNNERLKDENKKLSISVHAEKAVVKIKETSLTNLKEILRKNNEEINKLKDAAKRTDGVIADLRKQAQQSVINIDVENSEDKALIKELREQVSSLKQEIQRVRGAHSRLEGDHKVLRTQLQERERSAGQSTLTDPAKDALIEKLKKTIKSQKTMLSLKQQEIDLIKEGGLGDVDIDLD